MSFTPKKFVKYFFLFSAISSMSNIQAAFKPAEPGKNFEDIALAHQAYATESHFSPVGAVIGGDLFATGTLVGKNDRIITCAHIVEAAIAEGKKLCFRLPIGQGSILKPEEYHEYSIKEWIIAPGFRHGGPDIAVGILGSAAEGVEPAIIGLIKNTELSERLWDDLPSSPDTIPSPRYLFSSATIGRNGPWDVAPETYPQTDGKKRAYNCYLRFSHSEVVDAKGVTGFHSSTTEASDMGIKELLGGSCPGASGGPLFIKNVKSGEPKWRFIAVGTSGGPVGGKDHKSSWIPLDNLPKGFLTSLGF